MELEEYYVQKEALENPFKLYNTTGQIRIFKYLIDKSLVPSEKEKELRVMYDDALSNFYNESTDDEIHKILKYETETPRTWGDWKCYFQHPKLMVRMLLSPFVPLNLAFCFLFLIRKPS